jgi:hypothetical protein
MAIQLRKYEDTLTPALRVQRRPPSEPRYACEHEIKAETKPAFVVHNTKEGTYRIMLCADCAARRQEKGENYIYPFEESPIMKGVK